LVDRIWCESLSRARKESSRSERDAASIGGILLSKVSLLDFRKAQRGREKKSSMRGQNTPATAKKRQVPHDGKQYDFPSGSPESLDFSEIPAL
jgi:hypothetical protein